MTKRMQAALAWMTVFFSVSCLHRGDPNFAERAKAVNARANEAAIARLGKTPEPERLAFALFADSHEDYRDLRRIVREINDEPGIDFVVNLGDFTNEGKPRQYERFLESAKGLEPPVFTVAGNHDAENGGLAPFAPIFGPTEFAFDRKGLRFMAFYSAGAEDPTGFDPAGFAKRVLESPLPVIVLTHVTPTNARRFSAPALAEPLGRMLSSPKLLMVAAGHYHRYDLREADGVVHLQVPRVRGRQWVRVDVESVAGLRPKLRVSPRP